MSDLTSLSDDELLAAYRAAKPTATPAAKTTSPEDFAKVYGGAAERAAKALNVDPQMLLGQWGLETGWGKSIIPGTNNLGNIKDFSGSGTAATDNMTGSRDRYRTYESPDAFADDYVSLVQRKYPGAVGAKDAQSFASSLKAGGYAEDPRYVDKVVQATRMAGERQNPVMKTLGKAADAILPSANAGTLQDMSDADLLAAYQKLKGADTAGVPRVEVRGTQADTEEPGVMSKIGSAVLDYQKQGGAGLIRGAGSIGATLLRPFESAEENAQRRQSMDDALTNLLGADPNSFGYGAGKLAAEVAGTGGVGGAIAAPLRAAGLARLAGAVQSGGMQAGAGNFLSRLATRGAGGAVAGGAAAGLVNPDDALTGAAIGGAIPMAGQVAAQVGSVAGRAMAGAPVSAGAQQAAQAGRQAGYVVPPSQAGGGFVARALEGSGGKIKTAQNASARNQEVTNELVRKDLGIAANTPITPQTLDQVRQAANSAYAQLGAVGNIPITPKFQQSVQSAAQRSQAFNQNFPQLVNKDVDDLVNSFSTMQGFDSQSGIEAIKRLREAQRSTLSSPAATSEAKEYARVQGRIANALEDAIEDGLKTSGQTQLLDDFRKARTILAKAYDVEKAMNPTTGTINAQVLARQLQKGRPMTGGTRQAAEFSQAFPLATQTPERIGSQTPWSPLDLAATVIGGGGAYAASNGNSNAAMLPLALMAARPAARSAVLSRLAQSRVGAPAGNNALMQLLMTTPEGQAFLRSAPVMGSAALQP